jgi:hypothetical protein
MGALPVVAANCPVAWSFASKAVNRNVSLVGTRAGYGTYAIGRRRSKVVADDTGLKTDQRCWGTPD